MDKKTLNLDVSNLLDEQENIYCLARIGKEYLNNDYPDLEKLDKQQLIKIINYHQDKSYQAKGLFNAIVKLGFNIEDITANVISELDLDIEVN